MSEDPRGHAHPRYPGYDVLSKRHTQSWDEPTRRVVDHRIAVSREPRFFTQEEWRTLGALCERIMPQPAGRPPVPLPSYVDEKMEKSLDDGFREGDMPYAPEAWKRGLAALDAEARERHGRPFHAMEGEARDALLRRMQRGELDGPAWGGMPAKSFFSKRVLVDVVSAYYAHPTAWNEIGWGGPASPRGYVRMELNRRDPWEAAEAKPGQDARALRENKRVG